ncbi:MAG: GIY-YIG nuclease family protein [Gammaproteobacteria bacterium]
MKRASAASLSARTKPYYVYLLECRGGRLYCGITTDVARRIAEHRQGQKGAKFTRAYSPVKLRAVQRVANRSAALRAEAAVKQLRHWQKLTWAKQHSLQGNDAKLAGPSSHKPRISTES